MKLYHRTTPAAARSIVESGFCDTTGFHLTGNEWTGVWLSNVPLDVSEGAKGDVLVEVKLEAAESDLADYEWVEDEKPYREWLVPADFVNARASVRILEVDEEPPWRRDRVIEE